MSVFEQAEAAMIEAAQSLRETQALVTENSLQYEAMAEAMSEQGEKLAAIQAWIDSQDDAPEPEEPEEPHLDLPEEPKTPALLASEFTIKTDKYTFMWSQPEGFVEYGLEIGTTLGGSDLYHNTGALLGGSHEVGGLSAIDANKIHARLWAKPEGKPFITIDYEFALDIPETEKPPIDMALPPSYGAWPLDADSVNFRSTYNALEGFHLMNQGLDFVHNFRFPIGTDGRTVEVTNQSEFDAARNNGDIGRIKFVSSKPVVLVDRRRDHNSVQLLICDTLSFVRTWGNLAIDCATVSVPQGGGSNVIVHGSNVLFSKRKEMRVLHTWADITIQAPSPKLIKNVITQGGARKGQYSAGAERVTAGVAAWTGDWEQYWDDGISRRDFDINTDGVGMQGMEDGDAGADSRQDLEMIDWLDPSKSNHPHGTITNSNGFVIGCLMAVTKAKWDPALGEGEQGVDQKTALAFLMEHCVTSGFMVNKVGSNSSWGGGMFSSHFSVNNTRVRGCVGANQHRHVEIGSGDQNLIEECLFANTQDAYDYVTKLGHNAGGQFDIVGYKEDRYSWAKRGAITAVQARNNVYDHTPRHQSVGLTTENEIVTNPKFNVYKTFGEYGSILIGTTDPVAKGSIWYAG